MNIGEQKPIYGLLAKHLSHKLLQTNFQILAYGENTTQGLCTLSYACNKDACELS